MNMTNLRRTRIPGWFEYYRETCPICSKRGGCMVHEKGDTVVCIRIESKIVFSKNFQSWVHRLEEKQDFQVGKISEAVKTHKKISATMLDLVYQVMLENQKLEMSHMTHLTSTQRGMSKHEVEKRGYRSFSKRPWEVVEKIVKATGYQQFPGIPGFHKNKYGWTISGMEGIMIPYRNQFNQIVGFQIRVDNPRNDVEVEKGSISGLMARVKQQPNLVQVLDDGEIILEKELKLKEKEEIVLAEGKGSVKLVKGQRYFWLSSANRNEGCGAGDPLPMHIAVPTTKLSEWETGTLHKTKSVWLTEGALKADIAADHIEKVYDDAELNDIGSTIIAVPGVNTWRSVLPVLEDMDVETVTIAFDMDAISNKQVEQQLKMLIVELKSKGYHANIAMWNKDDGNGIDDVFINKRYPKIKKLF